MVANSQRNDIAPFRIDPWPEERWWLIFFVLFVAAGLFGWLQDCLTLSLLLAMTAYGVICWLKGRTANALLAATARAAEEDWRVLRGVTLEHATQMSQSSSGGRPRARAPTAVL